MSKLVPSCGEVAATDRISIKDICARCSCVVTSAQGLVGLSTGLLMWSCWKMGLRVNLSKKKCREVLSLFWKGTPSVLAREKSE